MLNSVNCYFTFFDVESKKILWITEISTQKVGRGAGLTREYGKALRKATERYIDLIYVRTYREKLR